MGCLKKGPFGRGPAARYKWGIPWGEITHLILTIDPNFQQVIQGSLGPDPPSRDQRGLRRSSDPIG